MFTLTPAMPFVAADSSITADTLNLWRVYISRALDAVNGGDYTNLTLIRWLSGGAGWRFDCPVEVHESTLENASAVVKLSTSFTVDIPGTFSGSVPAGASGANTTVWTLPSTPYIIEGAIIQLTGTATVAVDPGVVTFRLLVDGETLLTACDTDSWGGTTYSVAPADANKVVWGLQSTEQGVLLTDGGLSGSGGADTGAASGARGFAPVAAGIAGIDFLGGLLELNVSHSTVATISYTSVPYKIRLFGRLIA